MKDITTQSQGINNDDLRKFIIVEAVNKAAEKLVSTKDPFSLRNRLIDQLREEYEQGMSKGRASKTTQLFIDDDAVGSVSLVYSARKPEETHTTLAVNDYEELARWFCDVPDEIIRDFVALNMGDFAKYLFTTTGEIAGGCELEEIHYAEIPPQFRYAQVRVDPTKVANAMHGKLGSSVAGLLGGATNDD